MDGYANNSNDAPDTQNAPNVFEQQAAHRGITDDDDEMKSPVLERQCNSYVKEFKRITEFYSTTSLEELFNTLAVLAEQLTSDFTISDKSYKCKMLVTREEEVEGEKVNKEVNLVVNILKIDEEKHCVEFSRKTGDQVLFNEIFNQAREFYGAYVNATL